jgi:hypothetical protein
MKVTMILADHAQVADGKLWISGGGWTSIVPGAPFGVALLVEVPWDRLNEKHEFRLELLDADGQPVIGAPEGSGEQPVLVEGEFIGGRPPELRPGTPMTIPAAINFPLGAPLLPEQRYVWKLSINGESHETWNLAFSTRSATPSRKAA